MISELIKNMNIFLYDNTFEGLLSAVFYAYDTRIYPNKIIGSKFYQEELFAETYDIYTNIECAKRIWEGVKKKATLDICKKMYRVFLSEAEGVEMLIFKYIDLTFNSSKQIDTNYGNDIVLEFSNLLKKVSREAHRAIMFMRFQKTADGIYYAPFEPSCNVLPMTLNHFTDRFDDQQWVIYDTKRNYGYYYNLKSVEEIRISNSNVNPFTGQVNKEMLDEKELDFQEIWNDYCQSTTIQERKNLKVHMQFMPKRFWKYLPEKNFIKKD